MNIQQQLKFHKDFTEIKQSIWLDNIKREILLNNTLSGLIENYGISGLTSNPTIFEQALREKVYDDSIKILIKKNITIEEIAYSLMIEDIQRACDLFSNIYETSNKTDGYVSIEIPPTIEKKEDIIKWAIELENKVGRDNVMIKVQSTRDGIDAFEELIKHGINVNMTLIFSSDIYREIAKRYISAIDWRIKNKLSPDVFSVASFFVSRIDSAIDNELDKMIVNENNESKKAILLSLKGKAAISTSLIAYSTYLELFYSKNFEYYSNLGYRPQKLLWASTSTKNPEYKDTLYANELCLRNTINTMPINTIYAFFEHGEINKNPIEQRINDAIKTINIIKELGINYEYILNKLLDEGIDKFKKSYMNIIKTINDKINKLLDTTHTVMQVYNIELTNELNEIKKDNFTKRLFNKDATLWKNDDKNINIIKNSLGWLELPDTMIEKVKEIKQFTDEIINSKKFKYAVLLGMGGSSLASEVLKTLFSKNGYLKMFVLDSTNPDTISLIEKQIKIKETLFIFSSKSGGTVEPNSQFKYFYSKLKKLIKKPSDNFIAITDKGTSLYELATKLKFRKIFVNPSDIGGRFSVFSYFGLVPAALCGCDIKKLLSNAKAIKDEVLNNSKNISVILGSFIAKNFTSQRDKLTIILPPKIEKFGLWIEQLIAESTGKEGKGIVPVISTTINDPQYYDPDRMFVIYQFTNFIDREIEEKTNLLIANKFPVIKINIKDIHEISREFYNWEIATAICGYFMKINPFDQPDVVTTKEITKKLLNTKEIEITPDIKLNNLDIYTANIDIDKNIKKTTELLWELFKYKETSTFYCLLAYLIETKDMTNYIKTIANSIEIATNSATIHSYGPRYLHSTGQLFKGGKNNGIFIILTSKSKKDIKILGENYSFESLCLSQARADFLALKEKNRKVIMIHIKTDEYEKEIKNIIKEIRFLTEPKEEGSMPKTMTKKTTTKKTEEGYIVIDYPKNMEVITSKHYTIRIGTSDVKWVEVSINNGLWHGARHSVGYWWYDWNNIPSGTHEIIAKAHKHDGTFLISKRRRCKAL